MFPRRKCLTMMIIAQLSTMLAALTCYVTVPANYKKDGSSLLDVSLVRTRRLIDSGIHDDGAHYNLENCDAYQSRFCYRFMPYGDKAAIIRACDNEEDASLCESLGAGCSDNYRNKADIVGHLCCCPTNKCNSVDKMFRRIDTVFLMSSAILVVRSGLLLE